VLPKFTLYQDSENTMPYRLVDSCLRHWGGGACYRYIQGTISHSSFGLYIIFWGLVFHYQPRENIPCLKLGNWKNSGTGRETRPLPLPPNFLPHTPEFINPLETMWKYFSFPMLPDPWKSIRLWKIFRLRPFLLRIRATCGSGLLNILNGEGKFGQNSV
jgi:hypothetical protein